MSQHARHTLTRWSLRAATLTTTTLALMLGGSVADVIAHAVAAL